MRLSAFNESRTSSGIKRFSVITVSEFRRYIMARSTGRPTARDFYTALPTPAILPAASVAIAAYMTALDFVEQQSHETSSLPSIRVPLSSDLSRLTPRLINTPCLPIS